jgi:release factor glutamine methyltransferase
LGLCHRAAFLCGEWATAISCESFDIVVCNPPYIVSSEIERLAVEVRGFDPHLSLDGGADGLAAYRALAPLAVKSLKHGALLLLETGRGQGSQVLEILKGCQDGTAQLKLSIILDLSGIDRAVAGVRQSPGHEL